MATAPRSRTGATRSALLDAALEEFVAVGFRRASMEAVARRAGVSRATLYAHHDGRDELLRAVLSRLHDEHVTAMEQALRAPGRSLEQRLLDGLDARWGRFVALASSSPHAAELYDQHDRLCGDIAREAHERSERLLTRTLREAARDGEIDLRRLGLSAPKAAGVLSDCAQGAKGEGSAAATPAEYRERLGRVLRVLVAGLRAP